MYKLIKGAYTDEVTGASKTDNNGQTIVFVFDTANTDYQTYLKWLSEGNEPLPAENT